MRSQKNDVKNRLKANPNHDRMDPDDYESLPESTPLSVSVLAGATAGVAEHCVMYPVDSVKVGRKRIFLGN